MAKKRSSKKGSAVSLPTPKNMLEAAAYERLIGEALNGLRARSKLLEADMLKLQEEAEEELIKYRVQAAALAKALYAYAEANRTELTDDGARKTVELPNAGTIRWYMTPAAVEVVAEDEAELIGRLEALGMSRFVSVKKSLNKEALGKEPDAVETIEGLTLKQREKFAIRPSASNERIECPTDTKRWKIVSNTAEPVPE